MKFLSACVLVSICFFSARTLRAQNTSRIAVWKQPSYFRGFVLSPNVPITQQDLLDIKHAGATIAYIATDGFRAPVPPYGVDSQNIQALDERIAFCHTAGIYYAIAVRQGPGRYDVANEGTGQDPPSTVWKDTLEQQLYGSMLRAITARYVADTLFAGITPTVEPNPFFDSLCCIDTTQYEFYCRRNNFNLNTLTQKWVDSIRAASADIPILIQGPAYTNPTLFSEVPIIADTNIVYEFHNYHPVEYTEAADTAQVSYPGTYLDVVSGVPELTQFNRAFLEDTLLSQVKSIAQETGAPLFMGEFGMTYPHLGGPEYLTDMSSIALEHGWNFAYFDYWHRPPGPVQGWDYKDWDPSYWDAILGSFESGKDAVHIQQASTTQIAISESDNGGVLHIEWRGGPLVNPRAIVYDMLGREVKRVNFSGESFELSMNGFARGAYLFVVSSTEIHASRLFWKE